MSTLPHSTSQEALLAQQAFLRRLARSLVADEHRADDLAQDAALEALRAGPERLGAMRAWLRRVVQNLATDAARRERRRTAREELATPPPAPLAPDELVQRLQVQRRVLEALEQLDEPYRSTLFLRYWDDLAPSAIATRTGVPVSTVKSRLARGLARLRAELDESHGGERQAWVVALVAGFDGWDKTMLGTAAAAGGISMGTWTLGVAIGGALVFGAWWTLRSTAGPQMHVPVIGGLSERPLALAESRSLRGPSLGPRNEASAGSPALRGTAALQASAWLLQLEIHGQDPDDSGSVTIVVCGPVPGSPQIELEQPLLATACSIDVGPLFATPETRPAVLHVRLEHPQYLPLDERVLVSEELRLPETAGGTLASALQLVRATSIVTGTVAAETGNLPAETWVALYAIEGDEPAREPIERVRPGPDGAFRLRADAAEEHALVAWVEPAASGLRPETRVLALPPGAVSIDPIVLGAGAKITGQVSFANGVAPLAGEVLLELLDASSWTRPARLVWRDNRFETGQVSVAWDATGQFEVAGLAASRYRLVAAPQWAQAGLPTVMLFDASQAQEVLAPALDVQVLVKSTRVTFVVTSNGLPTREAAFTFTNALDGSGAWAGSATDDQGRIGVLLDPSRGARCKVDDGVQAPKEVSFSPGELAGGGPIAIALDGPAPANATLAIHLSPEARVLAEGTLLDLLFYDRANPATLAQLAANRGGVSGKVAVATVVGDAGQPPDMVIEADRTQIVSGLRPASYVLSLSPRSADLDRTSLLLPAELELDLHPGERVDHDWQPEVGGSLRINLIGFGAQGVWLFDAAGERLNVGFRPERPATGVPPPFPYTRGVSEVDEALRASSYTLRIRMQDGSSHNVPVQIEAGRVNDVEIDLGAL